MGSYNALMLLLNMRTEEVKDKRNGEALNELTYVALDESGNKIRNQLKSSFFGKNAGFVQVQKHFEQSK